MFMENQVQLFEHEQFGKIRVVILNGRIHFVAVDVCCALDIKNSRDALTRLDDDEKQSIILPNENLKNGVTNSVGSTDGNNGATSGWLENRVNIVNEPGFYRLVFSSRKKEALEFQRWVYHEVLPSIRETGSYSIAGKKAKRIPNPNRRAGQLSDTRVYVFEMSDGTVQVLLVKLGQSKNIRSRVAEIERETKLKVVNIYFTPFMSRENARLVEWAAQKKLSSWRVKGEFFSVEFSEACKVIEFFVKLVSVPAIVSDYERGEKLLAIVEKMSDSPERQQLLISSAKLIAGN